MLNFYLPSGSPCSSVTFPQLLTVFHLTQLLLQRHATSKQINLQKTIFGIPVRDTYFNKENSILTSFDCIQWTVSSSVRGDETRHGRQQFHYSQVIEIISEYLFQEWQQNCVQRRCGWWRLEIKSNHKEFYSYPKWEQKSVFCILVQNMSSMRWTAEQ